MRDNQPLTGVERPFPEGKFLLSKTDPEGIITYANRAFCELAGYSEAELLGQPHNIVRHPDMPAAAFAEMWQTIQNGAEWTGVVKNRCKNGDYYWTYASIMPEMDEAGNIIGYISVRRAPASVGMDSAACEAALRNGASDDGDDGGEGEQ